MLVVFFDANPLTEELQTYCQLGAKGLTFKTEQSTSTSIDGKSCKIPSDVLKDSNGLKQCDGYKSTNSYAQLHWFTIFLLVEYSGDL